MKKKKRQELSKLEAARAFNLSAEMNALGEAEEKIVEEASISETSVKCDAMCQTDLTSDYIELLEFECHQLRGDTFTLKEKLKPSDLEQNTFKTKTNLKPLQDCPTIKCLWQ